MREEPAVLESDLESLRGLLLDMARERSLDALLDLVVERLSTRPSVALARIWLIAPGDICETCPMRVECPDRASCLHLVASAGRPDSDSADWSRVDGDFRRFPIGVRKVGHIAGTGEGVRVEEIAADVRWIARPAWAEREGILGFAGQPLLFRSEVLGVIAIFTRAAATADGSAWLRLIADHAATAIANARAFEEIDRLRRQLAVLELQRHDWPGNVRELQNVIERAVITARCGNLRFDLPQTAESATPPESPDATEPRLLTETELRRHERDNLAAALERCGGRIYGPAGAAALLGIPPTTLSSRIKKLGLRNPPRSAR